MNRKVRDGKIKVIRALQAGRVAIASFMIAALVLPAGIGLAAEIIGDNIFTEPELEPIASTEPEGQTRRVIVRFRNVEVASGASGRVFEQREIIERFGEQLSESMEFQEGYKRLVQTYANLPMAVFEVDDRGKESLMNDVNVESVVEDRPLENLGNLSSPITTVGGILGEGFTDGENFYDGGGFAIVIIDDGVDRNDPLLAGKVIAEACFGFNLTFPNGTAASLCPGGADESFVTGAASNCVDGACSHGTPVAAAAVMPEATVEFTNGDTLTMSGTATGARVIAVQANVRFTPNILGAGICPAGETSCLVPVLSLVLAGYDYAATRSFDLPVAAVNTSIGTSNFFASTHQECAAQEEYSLFQSANVALRSRGIAPVVATGNSGDNENQNRIAFPACVEGSIAVGATNITGTTMAYYSNNGPLTSLLAPSGNGIEFDESNPDLGVMMWLPDGSRNINAFQGTSFSAPMVAGAFATLRQKSPGATVNELLGILQTTGIDIVDTRPGYTVGARPLIQLDAALAALTSTTTPPVQPDNPDAGFVDGSGNITSPLHIIGSGETLIFRAQKDFSYFSTGGSVLINDQVLSTDYYTALSGSTRIVLHSNYLDSLHIGTHTITVAFNDGTFASGTFVVTYGDDGIGGGLGVPDTGFISPSARGGNAVGAVVSRVSMVVVWICVGLLGISFMKGSQKIRELSE
jgi:hypothetical protein